MAKPRFTMALDPEQKERWEDYVEDSKQFGSLAQLIRYAVEREIGEGESPGHNPRGETDGARISEVLDNTQDILGGIGDLEDRLVKIEQEVSTNPEIAELANDIFELLPSKEEVEEFVRGPLRIDSYPEDRQELIAHSGLPEAFARLLEEDEYRVRAGIEKLQEDMALVYSDELDGRTRYYKEV